MSASFLVLPDETAPSCFMKPPRARKRNSPLFRHFVTPSPQGEGKDGAVFGTAFAFYTRSLD